MNTFAKLAIAAAAAVVIAVVGINLLPKTGGDVGVAPIASPSPSPTASPPPSPSPTPSAEFPPVGPLAIGTHSAVLEGVPLSFAIPASGWTSNEGDSISNGVYEQPDGAAINFWPSAPENVYADPCAHTPLSPPPSPTAAGLAAVAAKIPGTDLVTGPSSLSVGGRPAQHVVFTIRENIACDPKTFYLWYDESTGGASGGWRWAAALGATHWVWIIDVDGKTVWIDGETFKGADAKPGQEIKQIIDSIQFE
jgi:hypothetical protein